MSNYNERIVNLTFRPTENKSYTDTFTFSSDVFMSDLEIDVSGEAVLSNYDILDTDGTTWDILSFLMYASYEKILEIWQINKHLSKSQKKAFSAPIDTPLFIYKLTDAEKTELNNTNNNLKPPWKQ